MQRVLPSRTANANEVSVNNDNNEQFETSDSRSNAGPSSSEVSRPRAEQNRRLASCIGTEQSIELALGRETSEDEGPALERESDVSNCSLLSLLTETSFAFAVLLGKTRCMLIRYSQFETEP